MHTILAFFAFLARLFRPSQAVHASPYGRVAGVLFELRRNRSRRVRRYAENPRTPLPTGPGYTSALPAPRRPLDEAPPVTLRPVPADYVAVVQAEAVSPPVDIVRGYYRAHEVRQRNARMDRDRLALAVLLDVATATRAAVTA